MTRAFVVLAMVAGLLSFDASFAGATPTQLKVLTFNAWGIWMITPSREARMAAIGPAIAAYEPDLVAMQEVWMDADADRLQAAFHKAGLKYSRRFDGMWPERSGLLVASRYPITESGFLAYSEGSHPHIPWHVDWMANKGVARVRIQTPGGPVDFADTHIQASYGGLEDYDLIQLSQLMEAADFLGTDPRVPLIVAGDLNVRCESLQYRAFALRLGLTAADPKCGVDSISHRFGAERRIETLNVREVLTAPQALQDGTVQRLSDHPGVLVTVSLNTHEVTTAALVPRAWMALLREALPKVRAHERHLATGQMKHGVLSFLFLQLTLLCYLIRRGKIRLRLPRAAPVKILATTALLAGLWFAYLGLSYAPKHLAELNGVKSRLQSPLQAAMLSTGPLLVHTTSVH